MGFGVGFEAAPQTEVDEYMPNMVAKTAVASSLTANCVEAIRGGDTVRKGGPYPMLEVDTRRDP